jgi:hypothetical protein
MVFGGIKWFGEGGLIFKPEATGLLTENEELFIISLLYVDVCTLTMVLNIGYRS